MIRNHNLPKDILRRIEKLGPFFAQDERVIFAYLFGGITKGHPVKPLSDLDLGVYLQTEGEIAEVKLDLLGSLVDLLGTDELDLVVLNNAPLSLVGRILATRRVVADKQPFLRHLFESRIMREFFDFKRKEQDILYRRFA
ncbi:MAG: nucleotidyltransferase domain-containing protein [Proteobacteria bacterium]|nr:nucleotidyltransferase domain-containing protein [Desulfobulbaceae bacterium]MBU4153871.1 nucleotidyltransferase domain-containing protein [Pseudomonadota bacterium]